MTTLVLLSLLSLFLSLFLSAILSTAFQTRRSIFHQPLKENYSCYARKEPISLFANNDESDDESDDATQLITTISRSSSISSSPWASSKWMFTLNIGREAGTWGMPNDWGATGGRLALTVPVEITSDRPSSKEKLDPMLQRNAFAMNVLDDDKIKYVTMKGEQRATFRSEGAWKLRAPTSTSSARKQPSGHASKFMGYFELTSAIEKNDIVLPKGERLYMTAKCWREEELELALKNLEPVYRKCRLAQERLDAALEHETGDRRLDGTDPIQTLLGMKDTAQLVLEREETYRQYQEALRWYPTVSLEDYDATNTNFPTVETLDWPEGPWPGQLEWLTMEPLFLMVRRQKLLSEEYDIVGTWSASPILEGEE